MRALTLGVLLLSGCVSRPAAILTWRFEARPTAGEVRVMPVLSLHDPPRVNLDTWLGTQIIYPEERRRRRRTEELAELPAAFGLALPGAVNAALGGTWDGQFRYREWPVGSAERLEVALQNPRRMEPALVHAARGVGGEAMLVTWVTGLKGEPLTAQGMPGEVLSTTVGLVVVDAGDEPYQVSMDVGMALVTRDGEVVLRYSDRFEAILSERLGTSYVGSQIAQALAAELAKVWATDPELERGEPASGRRHSKRRPRTAQTTRG